MLESLFGCKVNANVYVTPTGANQAFEAHFDWMDSIIVQITGCKVWRVSSNRSAVNPLPDTVFKLTNNTMPHNPNSRDSLFEMNDGTLMYLPRGFAHEAATNCSSHSSSSKGYHAGSSKDDEGPSIHVTFGLETATDSTVEIFLHFFISTSSADIITHSIRFSDRNCHSYNQGFVEGQGCLVDLIDGCDCGMYPHKLSKFGSGDSENSRRKLMCTADENPTHTTYRHVAQSHVNENYCNKGHNTNTDGEHRKSKSTIIDSDVPQMLKLHFRCISSGSILQVRDVSVEDLLHLILHVAATTEPMHTTHLYNNNKSERKEYSTSTSKNRSGVYNDTVDVKFSSSLNSSLLRQALATTTFTTRKQYKPNLYDVLPQSLEYLDIFFPSSNISQVLTRALIIGIDMEIFSYPVSTFQIPSSSSNRQERIPKGDAFSILKKLNYLKRFMTSSPIMHFSDNGIENHLSILEIREIINIREWDVSVTFGEYLLDVDYFVEKSFKFLNDGDDGEKGSKERNDNLYCASWKRMTDELRQQRAAH